MGDSSINLPPGFQFRPTDEELVLHYLCHRATLLPRQPDIIPDLQLLYNPWEYSGKAFSSGNVYYFFNKVTESKATESGYWKDLNIDEPVFSTAGRKVGIKKFLVFYIGKSPKGTKTGWILQEYRLCNYLLSSTNPTNMPKQDCGSWVLCRVHECKGGSGTAFCCEDDDDDKGVELSCMDEMFLSFDDDLDDITFPS